MSFDPITKRSDRPCQDYFNEYCADEFGAKQAAPDETGQESAAGTPDQTAAQNAQAAFQRLLARRNAQAAFQRLLARQQSQPAEPGSYNYFVQALTKYPETPAAAVELGAATLTQYRAELAALLAEVTNSTILTPEQISNLQDLISSRDVSVEQAQLLAPEPLALPSRSQIRGWERVLNGIDGQRIERLSAATAQEKIQAIDDIIDNLDGYGLYDSEPENLTALRNRAAVLKSLLQLAIDIDSVPHGDAVAALGTEGAFSPLLSKCRFLTLKLNALIIDSDLDIRSRHKDKLVELLNKYRDALTEGLETLRARIATPPPSPPPPPEPVETPVEQPLPAPEPYPEVLPPENPAPVQQPSAPAVELPDRDKVRGWDRTLDGVNGKKIDELSLAQAQAKLEDVTGIINEYDLFNLGDNATTELANLRNRAAVLQSLLQLRVDIDAIAHGNDVLELDTPESITPILSRCRFLMLRLNALAIDDALDIRGRHKEKLLTLLSGYQDVLAERKTAIEQIAAAEAAVADLEAKVSAANSSISQIGACTVYREYQTLKRTAQETYDAANSQLATARAAVQSAEAAFNAVPRNARSDLSVSSISDRFETSDETMGGLSVPTQCARCTDIPVLPSYEQATTVTRERPQMSMVGSGAGAASAGSIYEQFDTFMREKVNPIIDEWWNGLTEDNPRYWIRIHLNVHYAPDSGCRTCQRGTIHDIIVEQPGGPQFIGEERLAQIRTLVQYLQFSISDNSPDFENGLLSGRDLGINMSSLIVHANFPSRGRVVAACSNHPTTERATHDEMIAAVQRARNSFFGGYENLRLAIDLDANSDGYVTSVKITDEGGADLQQYKDDIEAFATSIALNIRVPEGSRGVRIEPLQPEEDEE